MRFLNKDETRSLDSVETVRRYLIRHIADDCLVNRQSKRVNNLFLIYKNSRKKASPGWKTLSVDSVQEFWYFAVVVLGFGKTWIINNRWWWSTSARSYLSVPRYQVHQGLILFWAHLVPCFGYCEYHKYP